MEDGQTYDIPLDSGLDTHSSEMLVRAQKPLFQHNRQLFQGGFMPTSVRFEHDGWAAGNCVYQFKVNEAFVEAGDFKITRQIINRYPVYRFVVRDSGGSKLGTVDYVPSNRVLSHDADDVAFLDGVDMPVTGHINGKPFRLLSRSSDGSVSLDATATDKDIVLDGIERGSDRSLRLSLRDASKEVSLDFQGFRPPSGTLVNGSRVVARFKGHNSEGTLWKDGAYGYLAFSRDGAYFLRIERDGSAVAEVPLESLSEGSMRASFSLPVELYDRPQVSLQEVVPYLADISVSGATSKLHYSAADSAPFNKCTCSVSGSDGSDRLYKNLCRGKGSFDGMANTQLVEHVVPLWFGISVKGTSFVQQARVIHAAGDVVASCDWNYKGVSSSHIPGKSGQLLLKCTEDVLGYDGVPFLMPEGVHVWEGANDIASGLTVTADKSASVRKVYVTCLFMEVARISSSPTVFNVQFFQETLELSTAFSNLSYKHVEDMLYSKNAESGTVSKLHHGTYNNYLDVSHHFDYKLLIGLDNPPKVTLPKDSSSYSHIPSLEYEASGVATDAQLAAATSLDASKWTFSLAPSIFFAGQDFTLERMSGGKLKLTPPKKLLSEVSLPSKMKYAEKLEGEDGLYWGRCCLAKVVSAISISSDKFLTPQMDATCFSVAPVSGRSQGFVDGNAYFEHRLGQASCQDGFSMRLDLCSKDTVQRLFYASSAPSSGGDEMKFMPVHIISGSLKTADDDEGNLVRIRVGRSASSGVDVDGSPYVSVSGRPACTEQDTLFTFVDSIGMALDTGGLLSGNDFTEDVLPEMVPRLSWRAGAPDFYMDFSSGGKKDADFIRGLSQPLSLRLLGTDGSVASEVSAAYDMLGNVVSVSGVLDFQDSQGRSWPVHIGPASKLGENAVLADVQNMHVMLSVQAPYEVSFNIPYVYAQGWGLTSFEDNKASFSNGNFVLDLDCDMLQATLVDAGGHRRECAEEWHDLSKYSLSLTSSDVRKLRLLVRGVPGSKSVEVKGLTASGMTVAVDGKEASFELGRLLSASSGTTMDFMCTPVDRKVLETFPFMRVDADEEYQFLKQQWCTTGDIENFWWVDDSHVLALTYKDILLRGKTDRLSDWDGDVFEDSKRWQRHLYITSRVRKYFCTSAYGGQHARFVTVSCESESICIRIHDPLADMAHFDVRVPLCRRKLGEVLCPDNKGIYTYSQLSLDNVASQSLWSATCIDSYCIIGMHHDNNFNQWAMVIDLSAGVLLRVVQGYGFVGVNGLLTGGEIPSKYFDASLGFTGKVDALSSLSEGSGDISELSELFNVADRVVGDDAQQWYISKSIPDIVSHLTYSGGNFHIQKLPLNNNYAVNYDSASYASTVLSDLSFCIKGFGDIFPEKAAAWNTFLAFCGYPMLYYVKPRISLANYLQQTLGQAAYVHYNSTGIIRAEDKAGRVEAHNFSEEEAAEAFRRKRERLELESDELSFDRQSVRQFQKGKDPYEIPIMLFASALVSTSEWAQEELRVNVLQNQSATSDKGKKYGQAFLQNMLSLSVANMSMKAITPAQTSEVTALKSLDMFFSTSDKQHIAAGAGYVNHNFVAQCVSQSVTSMQAEFTQQRLTYILSSLTLFQVELSHKALDNVQDALLKKVQAVSGPGWVLAGTSTGTTYTTASGLAFTAAWAIAKAACATTEVVLDLLPSFLEALGGGKINSSITGRLPKHVYDVEGKHKYGSKTESFMYPCFGIDEAQTIVDESVAVDVINKRWKLDMGTQGPRRELGVSQPAFVTHSIDKGISVNFDGEVPYYIAMLKGKHAKVRLPEKMAYVLGTESFLPAEGFRNENIGESEPVFATPPFQDYILDEGWQLSRTASAGMTTWISCKDTKLIDGDLSNCVISDDFCGVASPYTAIEVRRGIDSAYVRPCALTPQVLALNQSGMNCCFEEKAYHAFDGYGYRVINWCGAAGMNKEHQTWLYTFLVNNRFKRSNKLPQNEFLGNFKSDPAVAISGDANDAVFVQVTQPGEGRGLAAGTVGEDKDVRRYAVPVFFESVSMLPATVKTLAAQVLTVVDGVTSLTTENRDLQTAYKAPVSVDFTLGKNKYRYTHDYICSLSQERGVTVVKDMVPCLGLAFIGATPYEAYFYSADNRQYYIFTGGTSLQSVDFIERFRGLMQGTYDFVNQEIVLPCLATFLRLDKQVPDDADETDNVLISRIKDKFFVGEIQPPARTLYNTRSGFRVLSLPCGITYQGPNRCSVHRFMVQDYMIDQMKGNYGKWKKVPRETYHPFRVYKDSYSEVDVSIQQKVGIQGWMHNPFLLVTSPLGTSENTDNVYEWELTFHWSTDMDKLYSPNQYAVVNVLAETMSQGGKVVPDRPMHVFLTKELFTTTGNFGYYTVRYQSRCGAGNRERLHIWSDQYICLSGLKVDIKALTVKRTEQLTQQVDIQLMTEV
jgi:hypothetical protein